MTVVENPVTADDAATENPADDAPDLWAAIAAITEAASAAGAGDFEARLMEIGDDPRLDACRDAINSLLDRSDAYVRESSASLAAAADQQYHRRFVVRGLGGAFRTGAITINNATDQMAATDAELAAAKDARLALAVDLEEAIGAAVDQVASAATEIEATAGSLADTADTNVTSGAAYDSIATPTPRVPCCVITTS